MFQDSYGMKNIDFKEVNSKYNISMFYDIQKYKFRMPYRMRHNGSLR